MPAQEDARQYWAQARGGRIGRVGNGFDGGPIEFLSEQGEQNGDALIVRRYLDETCKRSIGAKELNVA